MKRPVIVFPDLRGEAVMDAENPNGFISRVRKEVPDALLVPGLNGGTEEGLGPAKRKALGLGMQPVVSKDPRGLLGTLTIIYKMAIQIANATGGPVIRLDTKEHPPEFILKLIEAAKKGMGIADLDFSGGHLTPGSADEIVHLRIFPSLYEQSTKGKLSLSCAHGFQAFFGPAQCQAALDAALSIVQWVEAGLKEETSEPALVKWGFDGAMALGAIGVGIPVSIIRVPAESDRNRDEAKIADQFDKALRMCRVASKLYGW